LAKVTSKNKDYKKQIQKTKLKLKNNTMMYNVSLQIWLTAHLVPHFIIKIITTIIITKTKSKTKIRLQTESK